MRWPWQKAIDEHKREDAQAKEDVERRLAYIHAQVGVLTARAELKEREREHE